MPPRPHYSATRGPKRLPRDAVAATSVAATVAPFLAALSPARALRPSDGPGPASPVGRRGRQNVLGALRRLVFRQRAGFTLVELIIVVALIAILAVATLPAVAVAAEDIKVDGAARALVTHIRYAQSLACTEMEEVKVGFTAAGYSVAVDSGVDGNDFGELVADPVTKRPMLFTSTGPGTFGGMDMIYANFGGDPHIIFDAMGSPSSGGDVFIGRGSNVRKLTVSPGSGRRGR